jgi:GxxExxY protein
LLADPAGTNALTTTIIGCGLKVHRHFGPGMFESAYLACLVFELEEEKLTVERGKAVPLVYKGIHLNACYRLDLLVNGLVIVELKAVDRLAPIHTSQMVTYLKLANCPVGLIMNFNTKVLKDGIRRVINPEYQTQ